MGTVAGSIPWQLIKYQYPSITEIIKNAPYTCLMPPRTNTLQSNITPKCLFSHIEHGGIVKHWLYFWCLYMKFQQVFVSYLSKSWVQLLRTTLFLKEFTRHPLFLLSFFLIRHKEKVNFLRLLWGHGCSYRLGTYFSP